MSTDGVPLNIEQLTEALVSSTLLFLGDDGRYELEGRLEELRLPTNVMEAIRLRLTTLAENDAELDLVVAVTAVMGGAWSLHQLEAVWLLLQQADAETLGAGAAADIQAMRAAVTRGLETKLLKYVEHDERSSSARSSARRRSSVGQSMEMRYTFRHLKILDTASALLGAHPSRTHAIHAACAVALEGLVSDALLAHHHAKAGNNLEAVVRYVRAEARIMSEGGGMASGVALLQEAQKCLRRCEPSTEARRIELKVALRLITSAGSQQIMTDNIERFFELKAMSDLAGTITDVEATTALYGFIHSTLFEVDYSSAAGASGCKAAHQPGGPCARMRDAGARVTRLVRDTRHIGADERAIEDEAERLALGMVRRAHLCRAAHALSDVGFVGEPHTGAKPCWEWLCDADAEEGPHSWGGSLSQAWDEYDANFPASYHHQLKLTGMDFCGLW